MLFEEEIVEGMEGDAHEDDDEDKIMRMRKPEYDEHVWTSPRKMKADW